MASSNRDVELVVRAKNEASKALDAVTTALKGLTQAQAGVVAGTGSTTSVLSRFGAELGKLSQQVGSMNTFDKMTSSVAKASAGVARLESAVTELTNDQQKLTGEITKTEANFSKLTAETERLSGKLTEQKTATASAKSSLSALTKEVNGGAADLKKRESADASFVAQLQKQEAQLTKTQQRHRDLTSALLAAKEPSAALIAQFVKVDQALATQSTKLANTQNAYSTNRTAIASLVSSLETLRAQQVNATSGLQAAEAAQLATANSLKTTGTAARETAKALAVIREAADNNVAASARQTSALAAAKTELTAIQATAAQAGVSLDKIGQIIRQGLLRALADSQTQLAKYRSEWAATTAAIASGMAGQAKGAPLTPELTALIEKAKLSKAAVLEMQLAIQQMRTSVRDAGTDVVKLAAAEGIFEASLGRVRSAAEAANAAQGRLNAATAATAASAAQAGESLDKTAGILRQGLLRALADSQTQLAKYRAEWATTTAAIAAGMAGQAKGSPLTPELTALIEKARLSKAAVLEMQTAIQQMRTSVREAGTDVVKLAAAENTFELALARVRAAADAANGAQTRLNAATAGAAAANQSAANSAASLAAATNQQAGAARTATEAMGRHEAAGRSALSWSQRLRGELVALTTAYVGLYASIQQLTGVVDAYRTIEAAQSRMLVAFGSEAIVGRELRFVRGEAQRLGIEFGTLAGEYSKFAIATKGSAIEGEQTRKIFTAVSEAARVNKLSLDQIRGTYLALTQMVSKGNVSMEELRQQLGERLYGAFTLAAGAMNISTAELSKLIATGGLATDVFLPKFAEELSKTFGPGLSKSLLTLTTQIGQFQNEIFNVQEAVGRGGFIEGLSEALRTLTKAFSSKEGIAFFEGIGAAVGGLLKILAKIPEYATPITLIFSIWAGSKIVGFIVGLQTRLLALAASFAPVAPAAAAASTATNAFAGVGGRYIVTTAPIPPLNVRMAQSFTALAASLRAANGTFTLASVGAGVLTRALGVLRGALAVIGGVPGLIITGLAVAFTYWATGTETATNAVEEHKKQVLALLDAYSLAKDGATDWATAVKGVTLAGAEKTGADLAKDLKSQTEALSGAISGFIDNSRYTPAPFFSEGFGDSGPMLKGLDAVEERVVTLGEKMKSGEITLAAYSKELNDILKDSATPQRLKDLIIKNAELLEQSVATERAVAENGVVIQQMGGKAEAVQPLIDKLGLSLKGMAEAAGLTTTKKLSDPMALLAVQVEKLKKNIPSMRDELKRLEDLKELDEILKTVNLIEGLDKASAAYKQFLSLVQQGQQDINNAFNEKQFKEITTLLTSSGSGADMSSKLLKQFEGFKPTAYYDVNAYRAGFGSDTTTLADGSIQKIVQGMKVSLEDANRDLARRIGEFQNTVKGQIGADRFNGFNPQQQAALTSIAYNYGSLPTRIIEAVKTGSATQIADSIRGLRNDNNGINAGRRDQEAAIFQQGDNFNPEGMSKVYEEQLKTQREFHDSLKDTLEVRRQEAEADKRRTLDQAISLEITKAENDAKKAGTVLNATERAQIIANTTEAQKKKQAAWDDIDAKKAAAALNKDEQEGQQRVNTLLQLRRDLISQMEFAQKQGDSAGYDTLKQQLLDVTAQTEEAISAMIRFWEASGDQEKAAAAIASLQNMKNSLVTVGNQGVLSFGQLQMAGAKAFGQQLLAGANTFLDKVRETGDVIGSLREAFLQFAADFLMQIAKMIIQQMLLNVLKAAFGGFGMSSAAGSVGGAVIGAVGGVAHEGGVVGESIGSRPVNPSWFKNATKYHTGGVAGLKSNEIPTILEKGETIRTEEQEAALAASQKAGSAAPAGAITVNNAIDSESLWASGNNSKTAERVIMNIIKLNKSSVKSLVG
jgi:tape measure domain-containing protein